MGVAVNAYKKQFIKRYDGEKYLKYFTHEDFNGLQKIPLSFRSANGDALSGGIYRYGENRFNVLVIFCHGIGGGHLSYMKEIERLCRMEFTVLAYDATGCGASEGENLRGLSQSLSDLNACIEFIRSQKDLKDKRIFVVGHSMGGYAAGNILNFRSDVEKAVVLSGFISVKNLLGQYFRGIAKLFLPALLRYEKKVNPLFAPSSSEKGYEKTSAQVLVIHSDDDPAVKKEFSIDYLKKKVKNPAVSFYLTSGKKHNPNYTVDAANYLTDKFAALAAAEKSGKVVTEDDRIDFFKDTDWNRMTAQDDEVWKVISEFLKA